MPLILATFVTSLHRDAKTRLRVDTELSEELEVNVRMHQGCVQSPFFFSVVVTVFISIA